MKTKFIVGLQALALIGVSAVAQITNAQATSVNTENEAMIEIVNDPMPAKAPVVTVVPQTVAAPAAPLVLQNQPQITQTQPTIYVQKQATTLVQDTPLQESNADKLRKQRVEMEQQTESKIVEKLEESRMKAEEERAAKLLNNIESADEKKEEKKEEEKVVEVAPAPIVVAPQAVQVVAPEEPIVEPAPVSVSTELSKLEEEPKSQTKMFMSLDGGFLSYSADNIQTVGAAGVTVGALIDDRFIVEGSFLYSKGDVESVTRPGSIGIWTGEYYPTIIEMQQFNYTGAFKYRVLKTRVSPYVGGLASYVHRKYEDRQFFDSYYALEGSSWAIDVGAMVGADIRLTDNLSIGADFRYVVNIAYDTDTKGRLQASRLYQNFYDEPVEELGYYNFLVNAKFLF